ncbi:hypothetical protein TanjilG_26660 [Lupinus angustifolius]|uniref:Copia protein n=1 Tax=Lupinus angustifolius TaxID=3871 RepID=A0A1J7GNL9_LUPAN|nr:hypothetical protein TanjilG_26660 [Lupinus angustifolius]
MAELKLRTEGECLLLKVDNKSAINLAKNPVAHGRSKHIETRFHFLRDQVCKGRVRLEFCKSEVQLGDIFTKPLKKERFEKMRRNIGVLEFDEKLN